MRKINYYRMLLGGISLLGLANVVQAQCVTPPTCAQLGYTKTASECSGHTFLKCPFDTSVGYCDLETTSTPVPDPAPTYSVGDPYAVNNVIIGTILAVNSKSLTIASTPRFINDASEVSETQLNEFCENIDIGGATWVHLSSENEGNKVASLFKINGAITINDGDNNPFMRIKYCTSKESINKLYPGTGYESR